MKMYPIPVSDTTSTSDSIPDSTLSSKPGHIIFLWLENKNYSQIINSAAAPYINSLISEGTLFTNFHAIGHPSYPEYIRFFAGTDNGKKDDFCINGTPYKNLNLYTQLNQKGKTFAWYSEDLPEPGSDICNSGAYVERHNPTQCFSNVPKSVNKRWLDFPTDYSILENVVCISPNLNNDMHNGTIAKGDAWVENNLKTLIDWCKTHNSVFVVYFDEDNGTSDNHIAVIAIGQNIKKKYKSDIYYNHYNWTRTILEKYGADQIANSVNIQAINDCWENNF
jgi:phosphatidylinositol-3-phosphatase